MPLNEKIPLPLSALHSHTESGPLGGYSVLFAAVVVVLLLSFLLANFIVWCSQVRRDRRIHQKTQQLAQLVPLTPEKPDKDDQTQQVSTAAAIPVTILTGFLGAGKTTLLNRILHTSSLPYKIMVLENEIGSISIDHSLLQQDGMAVGDGIYVLQNGCMCCTARGSKASSSSELERILDYLLRIGNTKGFDYLVVETTGLADPGPIIETFLQLRASRFRLDAIVTMVDAHATQRFWVPTTNSFDFPIELQRQILYADIVVLNKMDLVDNKEVYRLQQGIAAMNEEAVTHCCQNADLDLAQILGVHTFDAIKFRSTNNTSECPQDVENKDEDGDVDVVHFHSRGMHTGGINKVHFDVEAELDVALFGEWLASVVDEYAKANVLRIKGVLAIANSPNRCIVQGVLDTYSIAPFSSWKEGEKRVSKLVIIGKHLDRQRLEHGFLYCLSNSSSDHGSVDIKETKKEV